MAISRQSDSIWVEGAMGYGHQHSPAADDDHYGLERSAREAGEYLGRKHARETIDHYNRDERGRFAPMPHHDHELEHESGKFSKREHRDTFHHHYHKGFTSAIKEHEAAEKERANKQSSAIVREAISIDPLGKVVLDDPGRFHYRLNHGGSDEGYEPPSWLNQMLGTGETGGEDNPYDTRHPTERHPYRPDIDTLMNIGNDSRFGLNLGLQEKAPFSRNDVGLATGPAKKKENREYAQLRPGEIASRPIQVTDHEGNVHTFVHQVTAPNLNPINPDDPKAGGKWVVSLHHHVLRPDGSAEWLPSEVSEHVAPSYGPRGKKSDDLYRDIWGQLHANSDMVSMYGAGAQRVGDKHTSIQYEFPHPQGDVVYNATLANGYHPRVGYYYDASLPADHREALPGGAQWIVTGRGQVRQFPHDPNSPTHMALVEGSDHPSDQTISFPKEDIPGVIDHVWRGLSVGPNNPAWRRYQQHQNPNTGGLPATDMIRRRGSLPPWQASYNIHRSRERLPIQWS